MVRKLDEVIYSINIEDIQTVAADELERDLTEQELDLVIENLPGYIDWYSAIQLAIQDTLYQPESLSKQ